MNWQTIIIAALCAILLGYSIFNRRDDAEQTTTTVAPPPGYYMKDAAILETGSDGNPRLKLHADNIQQDATQQNIELQNISLDYLGDARTSWLLTAQRGTLQQHTRIVTFTDDVELRPQASTATPVTLHTDQLSVDTEHNTAQAPGQVSITMNRQTLTAIGLRADLQRQTIRLMSQVHGEFTSR